MLFKRIPTTEPLEDIPFIEASEGIYPTKICLFFVCEFVSLFCLFLINFALLLKLIYTYLFSGIMHTNQTKKKLLNGDMVPTDRKGKILIISSTCDVTNVLKEFKNYLERHSHDAVLEEQPDSFPHRPDEVYNRRDVPASLEKLTGSDQEEMDNFIR